MNLVISSTCKSIINSSERKKKDNALMKPKTLSPDFQQAISIYTMEYCAATGSMKLCHSLKYGDRMFSEVNQKSRTNTSSNRICDVLSHVARESQVLQVCKPLAIHCRNRNASEGAKWRGSKERAVWRS